MDLESTCPFCGEPVEIDFDPGDAEAGAHRFVQDCTVCCHPIAVTVVVDHEGDASLSVERE